ncbi:MAG: hypothetical protein A2W01_03340 [Candidatus Solincola sediminis]|nr:MAG: hypothetical protein A2W01_03340 [Candidatus Solincola sediminis]
MVDGLRELFTKKNISLLIAISGFLIAYLFFFTGGINYSGPIGKYGGNFAAHLSQDIMSGEEFNNFLLFTWFFIPALGVIVGILGVG